MRSGPKGLPFWPDDHEYDDSAPLPPLVRGGQGRSDAEVEEGGSALLVAVVAIVSGVLIGVAAALAVSL